jgi:hypothetical protein
MTALPKRDDDLPAIRAALDANAASALTWLLPAGRLVRNEFQVGDIGGSAGSSLKFNVRKLTGRDFRGEERGFKGVLSVFVAHAGDFPGGLVLAREYLGIPESERPQPQKGTAKGRKSKPDNWVQIIPPPFGVGRPDFGRLWPDTTFRQAWDYRDAAGRLLFYVARYDLPDGRKATPVVSYGHNDDGRRYWRAKGNGRDILFGLEQLAAYPDAPVLVVEGEKAACAARILFPGWVVVAWKGGAGNAGNIDVSPLAKRDVVLWPDADEDGGGTRAMQKIGKAALRAGADVRMVVLPPGLPDGWDLADGLPDGWTRATLEGLLTGAELRGRRRRLPAYYPGPTEPRDAALKRQRDVIGGWFHHGVSLTRARREAASIAGELIEAAGLNDETLKSTLSERQIAARKAVISRKVNKDVAAKHGLNRLTGKAPRLLVTGSQGSGKSRAAAEEIAELDAGTVAWWMVPTIDKAEEQAAEYRDKYARAGSPPVMVVRGRGQDDPQQPSKAMCPRHIVVNRAAARGVEVRKKICKHCPLQDRCGYLKQEAQIAAMDGGLFLMAREYAFLPSPAPAPDLFIGDESLTAVAAAEPVSFHVSQIANTGSWKAGGLDAAIGAAAVLGRVHEAATKHPSRMLAALRDAGVSREQLSGVISYLDTASETVAAASISGRMKDDEIAGALDQIDENDIPRVIRLLRQIRREWDTGRAGLNTVTVRDDTVTVFGLKSPRLAKETPVLLLDGTGSPALNRVLFGDLTHEHIPVERQGTVTGTRGKTKPKTYSRQSITGRQKPTKANPDGLPFWPAEAERLRREISDIVRRQDGPVFVCATMGVEEALRPILPAQASTSHFGAVRGKNAWEGCQAAVAVGREQPSAQHIEDATRPFTAADSEPFLALGHYITQTRGRRMRDGTVQPVEVEVHPDPRCQEVLEQIREAEIAQTADRVRPIFQQRSIVLLNELVLDVTYDRTMTHEELVMGGNRFERAWAEKGILPMGPRDLFGLFPELWISEKAAERELEKFAVNTPGNQIRSSIWFQGVLTQYRVKGQRGPRPSSAWIDSARHPDPRAALEALLGPVTDFRIITPAETPAEVQMQAAAPAVRVVELGAPVLTVVPYKPPPADDLARVRAILAQGSRLADLSSRLDRFKPAVPIPEPPVPRAVGQ